MVYSYYKILGFRNKVLNYYLPLLNSTKASSVSEWLFRDWMLCCVFFPEGWSCPWSWHTSHWGNDSGRQELLQDPLHIPKHLVSNRFLSFVILYLYVHTKLWENIPIYLFFKLMWLIEVGVSMNLIDSGATALLSSCCGAGTAADTEMTTQLISSNLELHSLSTGRLPRVATANRMLKQMLFRYTLPSL